MLAILVQTQHIVLPDGNIKQKWSGLGFKTRAHFLGQFWRMGAATLHIFSCRRLINPFLAIFTFRWMDAGRQMPRPGSSEPVWYQWSQQVSRSLGNGDSQFGALVGTETSFQDVASYDLPWIWGESNHLVCYFQHKPGIICPTISNLGTASFHATLSIMPFNYHLNAPCISWKL